MDSLSFHWQAPKVYGQEIGAVSLFPLALPQGLLPESEGTEPDLYFFFSSLCICDCVRERKGKRKRECAGMCESIQQICVSTCSHRGRKAISFGAASSYPPTPPPPPPPHPSSSLSDTSSTSINRDGERLAVLLLASDLQASLFPESSPQMREPMSSH